MRSVLIVFLVAMCSILGWQKHEAVNQLADTQKKLAEESNAAKARNFLMQRECAAQAEIEYRRDTIAGLGYIFSDTYTDHYNPSLNKCFMLRETSSMNKSIPTTAKRLDDPFEEKEYGTYVWTNREAKPFWDVAPISCSTIDVAGKEHFCKSSEEFDAFTKQLME